MRQRRAGATAGTIDPRFPLSRRLLTRVAIALAVLWMAWAFAQEGWTASRLNAQAADLRQRNAALEAQNQQYSRDIATVQSGAASEEVARENGYTKPGEHVYVVGSPAPVGSPAAGTGGVAGAGSGSGAAPSAGAAAAATVPHAVVRNASPGPFDGLARWWASLWTKRR